jgi:pimeloyl-ACP methyl ester carboxylesterase
MVVPVERHGFAWSADDFSEYELVGDYHLADKARPQRTSGLGVPLVVKRRSLCNDEFHRKLQPFAATAILCPNACTALRCSAEVVEPVDDFSIDNGKSPGAEPFVLHLYNPVHCTRAEIDGARWPLAGDTTAPFAWQLSNAPNSPIQAFLSPDREQAQLVMLEPYQAGKIPIVFVHGLLSDPTTWVSLGNQLRQETWFRERYQVWVFRYPTGMPFLVSAATLRRELNAALANAPEAADDPAAQRMVLVGHSMGGLVSKLQVTESGPDLWNLAARRPLDEINASDADRERLREVFFFKPQPFIRHVIFIGTPHRGSTLAGRGIGRIGSLAVRPTSEADERQRRLVEQNPGVFRMGLQTRVPTSVDLLEPSNPLLGAMLGLTVGPGVELHSIIGIAKTSSPHGPSDGVVSLTSASIPGVESEKLVSETHVELHHSAAAVGEVQRILQRNLREFDRELSASQ